MSLTIGIVLFEDAEELDWAGPWEVFTMAATEGDRVVTIAERLDPVRCKKGLRVLPDYTFADAPELDVVLVPGGEGSRRERNNPAMLEFLRRVAPGCSWVTSVCTGVFVLEAAGPARAKQVTTHWAAIEELRGLAPDLTVLENIRYVRDGNLVTSAGVSAGIDMALWLVGQLYSVEHARVTQYAMEYDPAPPYAELV
jgi:Transcriptional regulator containing an amidase domain and an AraC-type DNA-binding HTH domain